MMSRLGWCWLACAAALPAQSLRVVSEFQRPGPGGDTVAVDRMESPREILSPAVARNAFSSFHLIAQAPPGARFTLYVGQNPDNFVQVRVYKETHGAEGIPDVLQQVILPYEAVMEPSGAADFWLDMWVSSDSPVRRIKVEPQIHASGQWVVYPMEVRVMPPIVPVHPPMNTVLPSRTARADVSAYGPWRELLCGVPGQLSKDQTITVRSLIQRNAQQDVALAKELGTDRAWPGLLDAARAPDVKSWCAASQSPLSAAPAEWYLRLRDFLYRTALH